MELKSYFAQDNAGNIIQGATCYLYTPGTTTLVNSVFGKSGALITNPFVSDFNGLVQFKVPNGLYDLRVVSGIKDYTISIQCNDVSDTIATIESATATSEFQASRAAAFADAAALSAGVYDDTVAGLAATVSGKYFSVPSANSSEYLILYKNDGGLAIELKRYPSSDIIQTISPKNYPLGPLNARYGIAIGGKLVLYIDSNGKLVTDHTHPQFATLTSNVASIQSQINSQLPIRLPMGPLRIRYGVAVGTKWLLATSDDGTIYPIQRSAELISLGTSVAALQTTTPKVLPLGPLKIKFGVSCDNKWIQAVADDGTTYPLPTAGSAAVVNMVEPNIQASDLTVGPSMLVKDPSYISNLMVHKLVVGQSNAFGRGSFVLNSSYTTPVMGTTGSPVYGDVFSKNDSIYGNYCTTLFSTDGPTSSFRILKELISTTTDESGNITGSGETILSAYANGFQRWLRAGHFLTQRMIGTVHAIGGTRYPAMKKGTATFNQALTRVTNANAIATTNGWNYEVQSISIIHGEAEGGTAQEVYEGYLLEWWSDYNTEVKAITGQQRDIAAFLIGVSTFASDTQQIALAQLAACEKYPALIYVCPSYMFPYGDEVHRLAKGNFKHGEYEMRAERFWVSGKKWSPLKPKTVSHDGNIVTIQFNNTVYGTSDTPGPIGGLIFDTTAITDPGNYGFRVVNSTTSITSVAMGADLASIIITLSTTPEATAQIEYAMQYDLRNSGTPSDPYIRYPFAGARGNVRDNDLRDISAFDSAPLYNWLVPFRTTIE